MNGSDDSKKWGVASFEELRAMSTEGNGNNGDDPDSDKDRVTVEFPLDTAAKSVEPIISDTKEILTMPPPPDLAGDPMASTRYFQQIDDENSGEAERIAVCRKRLQKIRLALSDREFKPERSFIRSNNDKLPGSVFLMPFPAAEDQKAKIKVYVFDHDETSLPLDEISAELMALTSYKDAITGNNLSRAERLNLIKALTEYYNDLLIKPSGKSAGGEQEVDLEVNYLSAVEIVHRLNFELVRNGDLFPQFRVGRDMVVITPELVNLFKQKLTKYFLDRHTSSKEQKAIVQGIQMVRSGVRALSAASVAPAGVENGASIRERKVAQVDLKIRKLQEISKNILLKITTDGSFLDSLRAMVMAEELLKTDAIPIDEYVELFELNDETEAELLAREVANARLEISSMNLPIEVVASLIGEFLTKKVLMVSSDLWEKMLKAEE